MYRRMHRAMFGVQVTPTQNLTISYNRTDTSPRLQSRIVALAYSASVGSRFSIFAQAFEDLDFDDAHGAYLGFSMNFGRSISAYASACEGRRGDDRERGHKQAGGLRRRRLRLERAERQRRRGLSLMPSSGPITGLATPSCRRRRSRSTTHPC